MLLLNAEIVHENKKYYYHEATTKYKDEKNRYDAGQNIINATIFNSFIKSWYSIAAILNINTILLYVVCIAYLYMLKLIWCLKQTTFTNHI